MPGNRHTASENHLLAALPQKERKHFLARTESMKLRLADVLAEPGAPITHVHFPTGSVIALTTKIEGCNSLEVGMIGDEGMLGMPAVLGVDTSSLRACVQGEGWVLRMDVDSFREELAFSSALDRILRRYLYVLTDQLVQTAACTRFHVVEARLACWLLMTQDRSHSDRLHGTHEYLAFMLGVRRVGITRAASSLQSRNLIGYRRGEIRILDRPGLEAAACGCYRADRASYRRIMGQNGSEPDTFRAAPTAGEPIQ